jgi:acetyl-CoA acetyltransferase family protein
MAAGAHAARMLHVGDGELAIVGGVEHMTRGPWVMSKASKPFGRDSQMFDSSFGWRFINSKLDEAYGTEGMGQTAENLVAIHGISREDQDAFALWSHQKAVASKSFRREEMMDVVIKRRKQEDLMFEEDEFIRPTTTLEALSKLRPAFKKEGGSVTAGNASGLNDGACALLYASEKGLNRHDLEPLAEVLSTAVVGVEPRIMGIGPVKASELALERAGLCMEDMDLIELNEAFAAQALACTRSWGLSDNDSRINPQGGAISLGHPLGMTGARLLLTASKQLARSHKKYALVTLCIGVGQGYATILKNAQAT